ncbi:Gfo/Idh/MocA family protein [Alicyclobacillus sp. SO9]|uniref:Gfo/Idh/MocA family protein n=1 Tax=Alicyclobacillus sp. SO9 TaxID=2665646 RepID=UPI0018E72139|nr:Gfo/Idh/MocA family oxidoreductase [Alicyclobacillus sp. SO9]QQE80523.1 Gfo/Idh/MocA family oxidoreductase [Alicyclobacillus sp. SO9]
MSRDIKIGLIGAGNIGSVHLDVFQHVDGASIAAITDAYLPLAEQRGAEYQLRVHQSVEGLLNDESLDAVIIGVPNKFHAPLAVQALQAGKHVLLEKPMGLNAEAAKEIVRAERTSGKVLMIAHQMRWQSNSIEVKKQIEKGALGHIYSAKTGWFRRKGIPGWGTWFTQKNESGGGPLIDIGVHMLDLALYLMGNPKPVSVFGSTYAEFGPKKKGIGTWGTPNWDGIFDVEDLATALIKMEDGSSLTLDVSWAVHMDTSNEPFVHLMGSEGGASIQGNSAKLLTELYDRAVDIPVAEPKDDEGERVRLSRHFVECVRNGTPPITSAMTGLANNLVLDAIFESSETGLEVVLDWEL